MERKYKLDREQYIKFRTYPRTYGIVFWTVAVIGILTTFVAFPLMHNNLVVGVFGVTNIAVAFFLGVTEAITALVYSSKVPDDLEKEHK